MKLGLQNKNNTCLLQRFGMRWLSVFFVLTLVIVPLLNASAQTSGRANLNQTLDAKTAEAEAYLEERLNKRLEAVAEPPFLTIVRVDFPASKLNALRKSAGGNVSKLSRGAISRGVSGDDALISLLNAFTPLEILANAAKVTVTVTLDQSFPKESIPDLRNSLETYLRLNKKRGDKMNINQKDLTAGRAKSKVERAEKESEQYKSQIENLQRELEAIRRREVDAQREVSEAKRKETDALAQLREAQRATEDAKDKVRDEQNKTNRAEEERRKLSAEIDTLKKQIVDLEEKNKVLASDSNSPAGKFKKLIAGLELPLTIIPSVLIALIGVLVIVLMQTSRVKSSSNEMNATMMQVSTAVAKIGESIVQAAKVQGKQQGEAINMAGGGAGAMQPNQLPSSGDSNSEELLALEKEAQGLLEDMKATRYIMLSVLKDWVADKRERTKFAGFSEAIGPNAAREIWKSFPKEEIELLGNALYEPMAKAQAYKVVLQLYRITGREISRKPSYFNNLDMTYLISATDAELGNALSETETAEAAKLLVLLTPERCARVIPNIRDHDSEELLDAMREATNMSEEDAKAALADVQGRIKSDRGEARFDVSNHLMLMLDAANPEVRTAVSRVLRTDKQLSASVGARVVTIEEVLRLDDETLAELLTELEPADVAVLLVSLPEELSERINQFFTSAKIQAAIRQELEKFNRSRTAKKRAEFEGQKIQAALIRQVKDMRDQGLIDMAEDEDDDTEDDEDDENEEEAS